MKILKRFIPFIITGAITALTLCSFLLMPDLCDMYGMPLTVLIAAAVFTVQLSFCFVSKRMARKLIPSYIIGGLFILDLLFWLLSLAGLVFAIALFYISFPVCAIAAIADAVAWFLYCGIFADTITE